MAFHNKDDVPYFIKDQRSTRARCYYANFNHHHARFLWLWPVTGQGVENTKWPVVLYSQQILQNR